MKLSNLFKQDIQVVDKKKKVFLIPAIVILLAIIAGIIWGVTTGAAVNLGMDFTGGYTYNVKLSTRLTEENYPDYVAKIESIFAELSDDNGNNYGLSKPVMQMQGSNETAAIYIKYRAIKADDGVDVEALMEDEVNIKLGEKLDELFNITPLTHTYENSVLAIKYSENISFPVLASIKDSVLSEASDLGLPLSDADIAINADNNRIVNVSIANLSDENKSKLLDAAMIPDQYAGQAVRGDTVSATISTELWVDAILAVVLALVLMLIYIIFRFEISMGVMIVLGLMHDILIMLSFIVILHIEINSTFIAALITIVGYSINNSIILFDRIRENRSFAKNKALSYSQLANKSVNETLVRTVNTTLTTLLTIGAVAIIGVPSIRVFAIPVIIGLIAGTYSTIFVAPTLWTMWKERLERKGQKLATATKTK